MVCTVCAVVGMRSLEEQEKWPLFEWPWVYAGRWENAAQQVPQGKSPEVRDRSACVQIVESVCADLLHKLAHDFATQHIFCVAP